MEAVLRYMAANHGVVTRTKALKLGMSKSAIARRVHAGRWVVIRRGVYQLAGAPQTWQSRALATALAYSGLVSHRAGARAWCLEGFGGAALEMTVDIERAPEVPGVIVHSSTQMALAGRTKRHGVPVTGLARTVLDLAAVLDVR